MTRSNTADQCAARLGRLLHEGAGGRLSAEESDAQRLRLRCALARLEEHDARLVMARAERRPMTPWLAFAAVACAGLGAALWIQQSSPWSSSSDPLTVLPEAPPAVALDASLGPLEERLADGSSLHLEHRARVRIHTDPRDGMGAVIVEQGTVNSSFQSSGVMRSLFVGPFHVRAEGARLTTTWDPSEELVHIVVQEGAVRAESSATGSIAVRAGQRFTANVKKGTHSVSDLSEEQPVRAAKPPSRPVAAMEDADRQAMLDAKVADLQKPFAAGNFDEVIRRARAYGVKRCLDSCTEADLRVLGDAARYTGEASLAEQAFRALEKRPGSAATAAFLLGRHHEARQPGESLKWYRQYLSREPQGNYSAEALAGTMRLLEGMGHLSEAQNVARTYLESFPQGVHAARARQLLERP